MVLENSGKIYRFRLDHDLGFGFAEVYDFTDISMFDGRIIYVFNRLDSQMKAQYAISEIKDSGIALGPIRLYKFPNTRGIRSWKYLFRSENMLITSLPETKELQEFNIKENNWDNLKTWRRSIKDLREPIKYVPYQEVRHLETRIINSPLGVTKEFSMKIILDNKEKVSGYYDLSNLGNKNMFVYLVNTYYPLKKAKAFLKQIPASKMKS
jgi:hypothetical protein